MAGSTRTVLTDAESDRAAPPEAARDALTCCDHVQKCVRLRLSGENSSCDSDMGHNVDTLPT